MVKLKSLENEEIEFEKYILLSKDDKLKELLNYWEFKENLFYGKIQMQGEEKKSYVFINEFKHSTGKCVKNPFKKRIISRIYCSLASIPKERNINEGDLIIFKIDVNESKELKKGNIIKVDEKTVNKLENDVFYKKEELVYEINNLEEKKEELISELDEINNEKRESIKILKNEITLMENKYKDINEAISEIDNKKNKYLKLGLIKKDFDYENNTNISLCNNYEKIDYVYEYLYKRENNPLLYKKEIIEQFFVGLNTNQIIILGGAPGSGKTSLVEGVAEAIGAKCKMVYVRPNWNSTEDLLGFYNPIDKLFIGTPMIDAIIEASDNPEKIYFICLDEMNLGHLELYFSDFLSALYTKNKDIQLYSKEIYCSELEYIDKMIGDLENEKEIINKIGLDEYIKLSKRYINLNKYKPIIAIPDNVRFIGTINRDATTKDLSPKVIDRSIIINLNSSFDTFEQLIKLKEETSSIPPIYISSKEIKPKNGDINLAYNEFKNIIKIFNDNNIELNFRFLKTAASILDIEGIEKESLIDYIIATKVLPKLNLDIDDNSNFINELENLINKKVSEEIYEEMKSFYNNNEILTYWR